MAKVIKTIRAENGMDVGNICSFKTENYIGVWDCVKEKFVIFKESNYEFYCSDLDDYDSLEELDDAVYDFVDEHITDVFDRNAYTFTLEINE